MSNPSKLTDIDNAARRLRNARDNLTERATALQEALKQVTKMAHRGLKGAVASVAEAHAALKAAIEESPDLFAKPRSIVLHGIKLGYQKGKGQMEWEDDEQVVRLIRKHLPDQFDSLVKTTEKPMKTPLAELTVAELKKLGITVEGTDDVAFAKDATAGVDKLVKALLKGMEDDEVAA